MTATSPPARRWPWHSHPRESLLVGLGLGFSATAALAFVAGRTDAPPAPPAAPASAPAAALPPPPPLEVEDLSAEEAARINAETPADAPAGPAAARFRLAAAQPAATQALECLAQAVYYEAATESENGQRAVAQVVLNRVRHPAFPASVCGVVYQGSTRLTGCQFSFTCDGALARAPMAGLWSRARRIAQEALNGAVYAPVGNATHYHAYYVRPYWAPTLDKIVTEGAHIFYRWRGAWGRPGAFNQRYAGQEPDAGALKSAALAAPHVTPAPLAAKDPALAPILGNALGPSALAEAKNVKIGKDGKRIRVLVTPESRAAAEGAMRRPPDFLGTVKASDNLRYALDGNAPAIANEKREGVQAPLGQASGPPEMVTGVTR